MKTQRNCKSSLLSEVELKLLFCRFVSDKAAFVEQVGKCVKESLDNRMKPPHADCPFVFRERTPGIFFIREALFGQKGDGGDKNVGERDERGDDGGEVYG
jgi:hypothetical protein